MNSWGVTLRVAIFSAIIATVIGTMAAIGIANMKKRTRSAVLSVNNIPVTNPDIITGVSLMLLFIALGIERGEITLLLAHITFNIPYVILSVLPKLHQADNMTYEAALDLGATPFQALRKVLMPMLKPGMISGFIMAFTMSLDDFAVTFFTRGTIGLDTLSTYIYTDARKGGLTPELRPLITLLFFGILILLIVINIRQIRNAGNNEEK